MLEAIFARLQAQNPHRRLVVGDPGPGWLDWDAIVHEPAILEEWYATLRDGPAGGQEDVAGSFLALAVTGAVVDVSARVMLGERRRFPLDAAGVAVHRDGSGWCDGLAVRSPDVVAPPGPGDLAADLAALLEPAFVAIRALAPYGRSGMWGGVADHVGLVATGIMRDGGAETAWDDAEAFLDALAAHVPALRARPRLLAAGDPTRPFSIRGTCCLLYKTSGDADRDTGAGYCATCPLLNENVHRRLLAAWR